MLLRDSRLICLDEATSNLDNFSDQIVNRLIEDQKKTFIYITHKLQNISHFDIIYVLKDAQIV